jgi:hypothetical protein
MIKYLLQILCLSLLVCTSSLYGSDRHAIVKATGIPASHHVSLKNPAASMSFFESITSKEVTYYYGTLINDSMKLALSTFLTENPSCSGRLTKELNSQLQHPDSLRKHYLPASLIQERYTLSDIHYQKKTIVLLYHSDMGRFNRRNFKPIYKFYKQNRQFFDLYILVL